MSRKGFIDCDICLGKFEKDSIMYYMKNCIEHRITCNVCYSILTAKSMDINCPCCKNNIQQFIRLPCEDYEVVREFPFTI